MKINLPPTQYLIWGGAGLAVLLLVVIGLSFVSSNVTSWKAGAGANGRDDAEDNVVKYNLARSQRRKLFFELVGAVDNLGHTNKACPCGGRNCRTSMASTTRRPPRSFTRVSTTLGRSPISSMSAKATPTAKAEIKARGDLSRARRIALKSRADPLLDE